MQCSALILLVAVPELSGEIENIADTRAVTSFQLSEEKTVVRIVRGSKIRDVAPSFSFHETRTYEVGGGSSSMTCNLITWHIVSKLGAERLTSTPAS